MAIRKKRRYVQNLRTRGKNHPVETPSLVVHEGEIALSMDNDFPSIWFKKNDGTYAQFVDRQMIANMELATQKALSKLNERLDKLDEMIGRGIVGESITQYLMSKDDTVRERWEL